MQLEQELNSNNLTEGNIIKKLLFVAVPIMGSQLMQMAYNLADLFWLSKVGSNALASAGTAGMYMWLSFGFLLIGKMGAEIGVAQFLGKGDKKAAMAFSQNASLIAVILGIGFAFATFFFNENLIGFFNLQEKEVAKDAAIYLKITGSAMPLFFMTVVAVGTFNASGNSHTPFVISALGFLTNMVLDPIFIFKFGMGVKGAAIATIIAEFFAFVIITIALFKSKKRPFANYSFRFLPDISKIKTIFKWSLPIGFENLSFCFLAMITTRFEASFGASAVAVSKIGVQFESLSWLIGGGFGSALVAFVGQNYGAKKWDRIHEGTKNAAVMMAIWGTIVTLFFIFGGGSAMSLFFSDPKLITLGKQYLLIFAVAQLAMNMESVASGSFKGIGRTIPPSIVSFTCNAIRPCLAFVLAKTSLGLFGVWLAISITTVLRGLWLCLWYLFTRKKA